MSKRSEPQSTAIIGRLGEHPRHLGRPAIVNLTGREALTTFPTGAARQEIEAALALAGLTLLPDGRVARFESAA